MVGLAGLVCSSVRSLLGLFRHLIRVHFSALAAWRGVTSRVAQRPDPSDDRG